MSVAVAWQTSFDQLDEPARRLLNRLAWLGPEPTPEPLLDVHAPDGGGEDEPREALAKLEAYSLVSRTAEAPAISVHRLVADVARRRLTDGERSMPFARALGWVNDDFVGNPQDVRGWAVLDPLAPHVRAVVEHGEQAGIAEPTSTLMNNVGMLLQTKALFAEARPLHERSLAIREKALRPEHPGVATSLNNLAVVHYAQGATTRRGRSVSGGGGHPRAAGSPRARTCQLPNDARLLQPSPVHRSER
jgi:hypothetical protein